MKKIFLTVLLVCFYTVVHAQSGVGSAGSVTSPTGTEHSGAGTVGDDAGLGTQQGMEDISSGEQRMEDDSIGDEQRMEDDTTIGGEGTFDATEGGAGTTDDSVAP